MRSLQEIAKIAELYPPEHRRWCVADGDDCACIGCVCVPGPMMKAGLKPEDRLTKEEIATYQRYPHLTRKLTNAELEKLTK